MIKKSLLMALAPLWLYATAPVSPSNLSLTPSDHEVLIEWTDNAADEDGYQIFRDGELVAIVPPNVESYHDSALSSLTNYHYEVRAKGRISGNASDILETSVQGILDEVGGTMGMMVLTPRGQGAVVAYRRGENSYLELWGLDNPNNPLYEYRIETDTTNQTKYENVKMLGDGKISYTYTILSPDNDITTFKVIYDYFAQTRISTTTTLLNLESGMGASVDRLYRRDYNVIPTHIQISNTKKLDHYLYLGDAFVDTETWFDARYGQVIYDTRDNSSYELSHAQEGPGGTTALNVMVNTEYHCLSYTEVNSFDDTSYSVIYDYGRRVELSRVEHDVKTEQNIFHYLSAEYGTQPYHNYKVASSELLENNLFLVTYFHWNGGDDFAKTEIFKITASDSAELYETLAHIKYGPGGYEAHDISIDRANDVITYTTPMNYEWIQIGKSDSYYNMNEDILIAYNYTTKEFITRLPLANGGYETIYTVN